MSIETVQRWGTQYRSATIEDLDVAKSEMLVRAVPYDVPTDIGAGITETFKRGAFARAAKAPARLFVWNNHGGPVVGRGLELEDRDDGPWIRAKLSRSTAAKDMLMDIDDGISSGVSIEFVPKSEYMDITATPGGLTVVHRRAHLLGFAIVPEGAYGKNAFIASVREEDETERAREAMRLWLEKAKRGA